MAWIGETVDQHISANAKLYTLFDNPLLAPPPSLPCRNVVLLGVSTDGVQYDIAYVRNKKQLVEAYGSGPLVDAYNDTLQNGAYAIYVMRLNIDGEDTLTTLQMYERLGEAYDIIQGFPAHIVVPVGVYIDDDQPFGRQLLDFCISKKDDHPALGVIGVKAPADVDDLDAHIDALMSNEFMLSNKIVVEDGKDTDTGCFLCVVAHDVKIGSRTTSGAPIFAGLLSSLEPKVSSTNKALYITDLPYRFNSKMQAKTFQVTLSQSRMLLPRTPITNPIVKSTDGLTTFQVGVDYEIDWKMGAIEILDGSITLGMTVNVTFSYSDANSLASRGYITFRDSIRKGIVPYRGVTAARPDSAYHTLSATRVVLELLEQVREIKLEAIGGPVTQTVLNKLKDVLKKLLDSKVKEYAIMRYEVQLSVTPDRTGIVIQTGIVPIGDHEEITSVVSLNI